MQEKFTVTILQEHDQQAQVKSNYGELEGDFMHNYVNFSGYFGHQGPHKFAQGPVLYDALEVFAKCADELDGAPEDGVDAIDDDEWVTFRLTAADYRKARAALKLARGEV